MTESIQAVLTPGQAYTRAFTAGGQFTYCLKKFPDQINTVVVLGGLAADFRVAVSSPAQSVRQGDGANYTLHLNALYGFTQPATLTWPGLPAGATAHFSPNPAPPTGKSRLTVTPTVATPPGAYALTIQTGAGAISHTVVASLIVLSGPPDLVIQSIAISPIMPTINVSFTVSLSLTNQSATPIAASFAVDWYVNPTTPPIPNVRGNLQWTQNGLAAGQTITLSNIYTLTTSGVHTYYGRVDTSAAIVETDEANNISGPFTLSLPTPPPDFTIGITPESQTVVQGSNLTDTLHLTPLNGFSDPVTLTVTDAPTETMTQLVANPITPPTTTLLTITPVASAPLGTHPLTVQGMAGSLNHVVTASLTVIQPELDIVVVLDKSGSMEFDPVCYGCWERTETAEDHQTDDPRWSGYYTYPANGVIFPIGGADGYDHPSISGNGGVCDAQNAAVCQNGGYNYIIMEAELYSGNNTVVSSELREGGKGYWALQRGEGNYGDETTPYYNSAGYTVDGSTRGAHMAHHPSLTDYLGTIYGFHYALGHAQNNDAPALQYDFKFNQGGATWTDGHSAYIWVRMHAGRGLDVDNNDLGDTHPEGINKAYWTVASEADDGDLAMDDRV